MSNNEKVYLNGYLDVPPERWDKVVDALPKHIELTLAETGCISFKVNPCPNVENRLIVTEVFENQSAFDFHQVRTKASEWIKTTRGIECNFNLTVGKP